ncbi:hypothetical protein M8R20_16590 [Pseudomonas sp. R2.Fl]|nr:hypothetical protein [Pseudomonas sp. R2.Fl]
MLSGLGALIATLISKLIDSFVRHSQSVEARRDDDLAEMITTANLLAQLCEKFWTKSATELGGDNQLLRSHIIAAQHLLTEINAELFTGQPKRECDVLLFRLFDAASGGNFDDPEREAEPGCLTKILIGRNALLREARRSRRKLRRKLLS